MSRPKTRSHKILHYVQCVNSQTIRVQNILRHLILGQNNCLILRLSSITLFKPCVLQNFWRITLQTLWGNIARDVKEFANSWHVREHVIDSSEMCCLYQFWSSIYKSRAIDSKPQLPLEDWPQSQVSAYLHSKLYLRSLSSDSSKMGFPKLLLVLICFQTLLSHPRIGEHEDIDDGKTRIM